MPAHAETYIRERTFNPRMWDFSDGNGLSIEVQPSTYFIFRPPVPVDSLAGEIKFKPRGSISERLSKGIQGLASFFKEMESKGLAEPEVLFGITNKKMAKIAERLGFKVTDAVDDEYFAYNTSYMVVGKTSDVKKRLQDLLSKTDRQGRNVVDLVKSRAESRNKPVRLF